MIYIAVKLVVKFCVANFQFGSYYLTLGEKVRQSRLILSRPFSFPLSMLSMGILAHTFGKTLMKLRMYASREGDIIRFTIWMPSSECLVRFLQSLNISVRIGMKCISSLWPWSSNNLRANGIAAASLRAFRGGTVKQPIL